MMFEKTAVDSYEVIMTDVYSKDNVIVGELRRNERQWNDVEDNGYYFWICNCGFCAAKLREIAVKLDELNETENADR